jgi:5-deoxy-glucuronate isomerase
MSRRGRNVRSPDLTDIVDGRVVRGSVSVVCGTTPAIAGWRYVTFAAVDLSDAEISIETGPTELAVVPLEGSVDVRVDRPELAATLHARLDRGDLFADRGSVVYAPPGSRVTIAGAAARIALGAAPAIAEYPPRLFAGDDIRVELRGGGAARRQVSHLLAPPLPAHRLIIYEVLVPRGSWSGWPPHCHDGHDGSPYLEETYYFEHRPRNGFGIHRNFREAAGLDDVFVVPDRGLVTVPAGYHCSAAGPGSHMYFLNILAGDLEHDERRTPPCFDERYVWIDGHWDDDPLLL